MRSPGWPTIHYVSQAGPELTEICPLLQNAGIKGTAHGFGFLVFLKDRTSAAQPQLI